MRSYNRKLGCENQKETNKTSIMAQIHSLKDVLDNFHCVLFAHKANTSRTSAHSHRYLILLKSFYFRMLYTCCTHTADTLYINLTKEAYLPYILAHCKCTAHVLLTCCILTIPISLSTITIHVGTLLACCQHAAGLLFITYDNDNPYPSNIRTNSGPYLISWLVTVVSQI